MQTLLILLFSFCLVVSFLLSGMESGVFALNRLRIRHQMRGGNRRAQVLYGYLQNPERFLWTILVGNTVSNLVITCLGVVFIFQALGQWPWLMAWSLLAGFAIFYAFCELLPKTIFRLYPNRFCMYVAPFFRVIHVALGPLVSVFTLIADSLLRWTGGRKFTGRLFGNREELRRVMQESSQGLSSEERQMINRVLDIQNISLRQVAVPIARVVSVGANTPIRDSLKMFREEGFSRLPVWKEEGGRRRIIGLVNLNNIIYQPQIEEAKTAGDYISPALYFDQEVRLEVGFREMQRKGQRLAIVLDHNRMEWGIVSLQDILKVIFGEVTL